MERFLYSWKRRFCATLEPILLSVSVAVARFGFDGWIELAGGMSCDVQYGGSVMVLVVEWIALRNSATVKDIDCSTD